jgi:tripartite-type tricarboxylate transporter receptor subunit TctC
MPMIHRAVATIAFVSCAAAALAAPRPLAAQDYPTKPVRVLFGYPPGGPTELIGRIVTDHLSKALGQPFVLEPKVGGAGIAAGQVAAAAPPDGYTLNLAGQALMAVNYALYRNMTYEPATAFDMITMLTRFPIVLEVSNKTPVKTYQEFVAWVKTPGHTSNYGSFGIGGLSHLAAELLKQRLGFDAQHIPYRGQAAIMQGLIQNEIQWSIDPASTAVTMQAGNNARLLAVTSAERWPAFPQVPTLTELGMQDAVWYGWFSLVAPKGTPRPIIDKLSAEVNRGLRLPEYVERLKATGLEPWPTSPEEAVAFAAKDRALWSKVVRDNNIKAE